MKQPKPVSPYLQRPLRSLKEVLRGRGSGAYRRAGPLVSGDSSPPSAHNNNASAARYRASKSA
ncbi:MAG TPA: hypothetical protein EYH07_13680 [Kiloniellaceae bacterium]|nr:hypothetical protein [Kiloniellaceae bacterium]HIP79496.1 hypothetical protein [Kiloniellaceae bacterium]